MPTPQWYLDLTPEERRAAFEHVRTEHLRSQNIDLLAQATATGAPMYTRHVAREPDYECCLVCDGALPEPRRAHKRYCSRACAKRAERAGLTGR